MSIRERAIFQNLVEDDRPEIRVQILLESMLSEELVKDFLETAPPPAPTKVGLSPAYSPSGHLTALAIATTTRVLVVQFHNKNKSEKAKAGRQILEDSILCNADCALYAFDLAVLACSLFYDYGLRIVNGINIQSVAHPTGICSPLAAIQFGAGDHVEVHKENIVAYFKNMFWDPSRTTPPALRAWISVYLPVVLPDMEEKFNSVKRVNTKDFSETYLEYIAQLTRGDQRLALKKAPTTSHDFGWQTISNKNATVNSTRFQSRIQKSANLVISVQDDYGSEYRVHGRTDDIMGRTATLKAGASLEGKVITAITSVNSDRATNAETLNAVTLLRVLQGEVDLLDNPFLKYILFPMKDVTFTWPESFDSSDFIPSIISSHLNSSQHHAVECMLSMTDSTRITMIQGPPGTGKTTVIAAYVSSAVAAGFTGIWLVAQTNVAVKNIAEKLVDVGFTNWKLLVSADFHIAWHEHLYHKVVKNIIRSDEFQRAEGLLQDCPVVLCTLSMLSNPRVKNFSHIVPISTLVVDEASQIAVNGYVGPLGTYPSLRKVCFIGDDKQLPPFGQDDNEDLKSVFEVPHLRRLAILLDTQCKVSGF
ncbi:uncharacterized protein FIBRA_05212 [Fibroporia radiculosa]|uniref:DNA2/NAM7 helicase helicase domain-containing protein n=1 Tax=Fibroporia radiculosa TaxID=599839 RepID=J4HX52_9APHY|nr:uncharacterized protein FIBRA_05212 [Fibroporia radiculosa]CCM03092.1 predicted protein [Fibroporia radiculosa]